VHEQTTTYLSGKFKTKRESKMTLQEFKKIVNEYLFKNKYRLIVAKIKKQKLLLKAKRNRFASKKILKTL
jgi:hypothetical protein